jgi:hypothetical protein
MPDWTSAFGTMLGYTIAAMILVLPVVVLLIVTRTRWFARRKRLRWASREVPLPMYRGLMDNLPPPFNEDPHEHKHRRD